ncbi:MAG: pentapeptide repeat-containing protein [Polyangiaceae bacterium]
MPSSFALLRARAARTVLVLLGFGVLGAAPSACDGAGDLPKCSSSTTVSREDLATGKEAVLCDGQTLVAPLRPLGEDAVATGTLDIPFYVARQEERDYCATDDDGERHDVAILDEDGHTVWEAKAGDPCTRTTIDAGPHRLRITHATPDGDDPLPDTFHTRLTKDGPVPTFTVASNECVGCSFTGDLPLLYASTYGFRGNYARTTVDARCPTDPKYRSVECRFDGTFDDATIRVKVDGSSDGVALRGSFERAAVAVPGIEGDPLQRVLIYDGSFLFRSFETTMTYLGCRANDDETVRVNRIAYATFFRQYPSCGRLRLHGSDWHGTNLGFGVIQGWDGVPNLRGADFSGAQLLDFQVAKFFADTSLADANFTGARIVRGSVDSFDFTRARFDGATIEDVTFGPATGGFGAKAVSFAGADLLDVGFGPGAGLGSATFEGAKMTHVTFEPRADFTGASFRRAKIERVTARGATWDGASMRGATVSRLDMAEADGADGFEFPDKVTNLVASNGVLRGIDARNTVFAGARFDGSDLSDGQFGGAELAYAFLEGTSITRANFSGANVSNAHLACTYGIGPFFTKTDARNADLTDAHLFAAHGNGLDLTNANAPRAYFCETDVTGTQFVGTNLTDAYFPVAESRVFENAFGGDIACRPATFSTSTGTTETTTCPNGVRGTCRTGDAWVASKAPPATCASDNPACGAQGEPPSRPCRNACDCMSRRCGDDGRCMDFAFVSRGNR